MRMHTLGTAAVGAAILRKSGQITAKTIEPEDGMLQAIPSAYCRGTFNFAASAGVQDWIFISYPASAIDERQFSCYNKVYLSEKEASCMGEGTKKQQISAGLLAHV